MPRAIGMGRQAGRVERQALEAREEKDSLRWWGEWWKGRVVCGIRLVEGVDGVERRGIREGRRKRRWVCCAVAMLEVVSRTVPTVVSLCYACREVVAVEVHQKKHQPVLGYAPQKVTYGR